MFKRIGLLFAVGLLISVSVSIVANLVLPYFGIQPGGLSGLFVFCLLYGMIGSFVSLQISRWMAKRFMGVHLVDQNPNYSWLVQTVHMQAKAAGIEKMPEVGVYESPELNAFATGPSKNSSLVAVSTGLLDRMSQDEVEGVLGEKLPTSQMVIWSQ